MQNYTPLKKICRLKSRSQERWELFPGLSPLPYPLFHALTSWSCVLCPPMYPVSHSLSCLFCILALVPLSISLVCLAVPLDFCPLSLVNGFFYPLHLFVCPLSLFPFTLFLVPLSFLLVLASWHLTPVPFYSFPGSLVPYTVVHYLLPGIHAACPFSLVHSPLPPCFLTTLVLYDL